MDLLSKWLLKLLKILLLTLGGMPVTMWGEGGMPQRFVFKASDKEKNHINKVKLQTV